MSSYKTSHFKHTPTVLKTAEHLVTSNRGSDYGHPSENFRTTANLWQAYLDQRMISHERRSVEEFHLQPIDVAYMMALVKIARLANSPEHLDSIVDVAGYMATAEMCIEE